MKVPRFTCQPETTPCRCCGLKLAKQVEWLQFGWQLWTTKLRPLHLSSNQQNPRLPTNPSTIQSSPPTPLHTSQQQHHQALFKHRPERPRLRSRCQLLRLQPCLPGLLLLPRASSHASPASLRLQGTQHHGTAQHSAAQHITAQHLSGHRSAQASTA